MDTILETTLSMSSWSRRVREIYSFISFIKEAGYAHARLGMPVSKHSDYYRHSK